jgi:hypothetical protein
MSYEILNQFIVLSWLMSTLRMVIINHQLSTVN